MILKRITEIKICRTESSPAKCRCCTTVLRNQPQVIYLLEPSILRILGKNDFRVSLCWIRNITAQEDMSWNSTPEEADWNWGETSSANGWSRTGTSYRSQSSRLRLWTRSSTDSISATSGAFKASCFYSPTSTSDERYTGKPMKTKLSRLTALI